MGEHIKCECEIDPLTVFASFPEEINIFDFSVRDIARTIDAFTNSYRKEMVEITDEVLFLSDTPLVKLLAILSRLGVNRQQIPQVIKSKESVKATAMGVNRQQIPQVIKRITPDEEFVRLLGCFALDKISIKKNNCIRYNGETYKIAYNIDADRKQNIYKVQTVSYLEARELNCKEITLNHIIDKALKYIN